jgi:hypothetical protein
MPRQQPAARISLLKSSIRLLLLSQRHSAEDAGRKLAKAQVSLLPDRSDDPRHPGKDRVCSLGVALGVIDGAIRDGKRRSAGELSGDLEEGFECLSVEQFNT